ncbi:hypothetical protein HX055_18350, partial [Myroides odoratimimus]|nr:hypothetical protein [Myroides odoratimimus]
MGRINYQSIKKKSEVRVLNYNVHHFAAAYDSYHKIDLNSLAAVILRDEVDIVTLQEVDVHTMRSGQYLNQVKVLAEKTEMFYAFGKTIDYEGGDYGIAILS